MGKRLLVVAVLALMPSLASAQSEPEAQAKVAFREGQQLYDAGEFTTAIKRFGDAYGLMPHPDFLFNMAQCHRQLGDYERAAFMYRRFISLSEPSNRTELAQQLLTDSDKKAVDVRKRKEEQEALARTPPPVVPSQGEAAVAGLSQPRAATVIEERPVLTRWWVWATVGAVVAAGAVTYAVASQQQPNASLGEIRF